MLLTKNIAPSNLVGQVVLKDEIRFYCPDEVSVILIIKSFPSSLLQSIHLSSIQSVPVTNLAVRPPLSRLFVSLVMIPQYQVDIYEYKCLLKV